MQETQPINNDQWLNNTLSFLLIIYNKQHGEYVNNKVCLLESILNSSLVLFLSYMFIQNQFDKSYFKDFGTFYAFEGNQYLR